MTDIVERLRDMAETGFSKAVGPALSSQVKRMDNGTLICVEKHESYEPILKLRNPDGPEAADEITRLRAELAAMRERAEGLQSGLGLAQGNLYMLKLAIEERDPWAQLLIRATDAEKDARAALAAWQDNPR